MGKRRGPPWAVARLPSPKSGRPVDTGIDLRSDPVGSVYLGEVFTRQVRTPFYIITMVQYPIPYDGTAVQSMKSWARVAVTTNYSGADGERTVECCPRRFPRSQCV